MTLNFFKPEQKTIEISSFLMRCDTIATGDKNAY